MCLQLTAAASTSLSFPPYLPYHSYRWRLQRYPHHRHGVYRPRDDYYQRQHFQDAETRCTLRLWRISRRGELNCEEDQDCVKRYGGDVYCRELQVWREGSGNGRSLPESVED